MAATWGFYLQEVIKRIQQDTQNMKPVLLARSIRFGKPYYSHIYSYGCEFFDVFVNGKFYVKMLDKNGLDAVLKTLYKERGLPNAIVQDVEHMSEIHVIY